MVLCSANCLAEVHFTTIFVLRNDRIFEVGGGSLPYPLLDLILGFRKGIALKSFLFLGSPEKLLRKLSMDLVRDVLKHFPLGEGVFCPFNQLLLRNKGHGNTVANSLAAWLTF